MPLVATTSKRALIGLGHEHERQTQQAKNARKEFRDLIWKVRQLAALF